MYEFLVYVFIFIPPDSRNIALLGRYLLPSYHSQHFHCEWQRRLHWKSWSILQPLQNSSDTKKTLVCQEYLMVISRLFVMSAIDTNNKSIQHFFALKNLRIIISNLLWYLHILKFFTHYFNFSTVRSTIIHGKPRFFGLTTLVSCIICWLAVLRWTFSKGFNAFFPDFDCIHQYIDHLFLSLEKF